MKIRNGFVSNSSSSSFCLLGWQLEGGLENIKKELSKLVGKEEVNKVFGSVTEDEPYDLYTGSDIGEFYAVGSHESEVLYVGIDLEGLDVKELSDAVKKMENVKLPKDIGKPAVLAGEIQNY